jgi:biotin carboxylase
MQKINQKTHVVFLESNPSSGMMALQQTKEKFGCNITFITSDLSFYLRGKSIEETPLKYADRILEVEDTGSSEALKEVVCQLNKEETIDAFLSFSDAHMVPCSEIACNLLKLPHLSTQACRLAKDKFSMREAIEKWGIPQPWHAKVANYDEAKKLNIKYPLVAKPVDGTASLNSRFIENKQELCHHIGILVSQKTYGRSAKAQEVALLEEFIPGDLVSVEVITEAPGKHHVLGLTNRQLTDNGYFVEISASFPVSFPNQDEIIHACIQGLNAIGVDFGPTHTELILSPKGPVICEINCRLIGGYVPLQMDLTQKSEILLDVVRMHCGEKIEFTRTSRGVSSCYFLHTAKSGILQRILPSPALQDNRVKKYAFSKKPGDKINGVHSNFDWLGYVITLGESLEEAELLAQKIANETVFEIS